MLHRPLRSLAQSFPAYVPSASACADLTFLPARGYFQPTQSLLPLLQCYTLAPPTRRLGSLKSRLSSIPSRDNVCEMSKENDEFRALLSKLNALATKTERDVKQVLNQEYTAQPPDHRQRWLRSAAERLEARKNPMLLVVAEFIYDKCEDESIRSLLRARNTGLTKRLRETHGRDFVEEATNGLKRIWGEDANLGFPKAYVVDRITGDKLVAYRTLCREATNSRFGLDVLWGPQFGILARSISEVGDGMITTAAIKHARKTLEKMCQQESAPTSKVDVDRENGVTATAQQSHKRSHDKALPAQVQEVACGRERKKRRRYSSIGAASSHAQERVQERDSGRLHRAAPPNSAGHITSEEEELSESDLSSQHGRWADTALSDFSASPQPSVNLILPGYDEDHSICRDDELGIFHHDDDEAPCLPASPLHSARHLSVPISNQTTLKQQSPLFLSPIQEMPEPSSTAPDKMIVIPPYMVDDDMDNTFPIAPSDTNAENDELVKARERFTGSKWLSGDCIAHVVKQWRTADIRIIDPLALKIVNGHDVRSRLPKLRKENRSLFVPFHHNDSHWVLFYVRNLADPVIEIYDSLNKYDPEMSSCIREFVRDVPDLFNAKIKFKVNLNPNFDLEER
jgi:hypothetical protein